MLKELREVVCHMWDMANMLDEKGVGKQIPFISEDSDLRHAMKAEVIFDLIEICGTDNVSNDEQISYLQYVLHKLIFLRLIAQHTKIMVWRLDNILYIKDMEARF